MDTAELAKVIKGRRSVRLWQDKPVPEKLLMEAVELATWAPNGGNRQNWHFYVVLNKATIKALADAQTAGRDKIASWAGAGAFAPPPPPPGQAAPPPRSPFAAAPAVIVVGTSTQANPMEKLFQDPRAAEMKEANAVIDARIQSVSAAITPLLLVLHQQGLGAVWMTGPLPQCKGEVEKVLMCPADMDIVALIPVGYPAETPKRDRRPVSEVSTVIR